MNKLFIYFFDVRTVNGENILSIFKKYQRNNSLIDITRNCVRSKSWWDNYLSRALKIVLRRCCIKSEIRRVNTRKLRARWLRKWSSNTPNYPLSWQVSLYFNLEFLIFNNLRLFMHGRKALTIDDTSESTSVLTLNPENQENQQSIHYARNES